MNPVVILFNDVGANPSPDDLDTLEQAKAVYAAVRETRSAVLFPFKTLADLSGFPSACTVFNLAEEFNGDAYQAYKIPEILEKQQLPFTGCGSLAMKNTGDKVAAKLLMASFGINTAAFVTKEQVYGFMPGAYLIKPMRQSGSIGIDQSSVVTADSAQQLRMLLAQKDKTYGFFAERYIDGREVSVSLIETKNGAIALPPREMRFLNNSKGYKILDYASKWDEGSASYKNTVSATMTDPADKKLLKTLEAVCFRLWEHFSLRGYARIDFRLDEFEVPFVLEVNCNPCLAPPDSSFFLAAQSAGFTFNDTINGLITYAKY